MKYSIQLDMIKFYQLTITLLLIVVLFGDNLILRRNLAILEKVNSYFSKKYALLESCNSNDLYKCYFPTAKNKALNL